MSSYKINERAKKFWGHTTARGELWIIKPICGGWNVWKLGCVQWQIFSGESNFTYFFFSHLFKNKWLQI